MAGRGRVLCSLVMALNTWQDTNWDAAVPNTLPPSFSISLDCQMFFFFTFHFSFLFSLLASPSKFSYVHPPPKLACLMSNSKVCISLRLPLVFSIFPDVSVSVSVSVFPRQSDSLRGKFSTLLYLGSSRSELIGRTDAKIVLVPHFSPPSPSLSCCLREWLSEWFTSTEAWFYAAKWVVAVVFCFVVFSWVGDPRLACSWQCLCRGCPGQLQ